MLKILAGALRKVAGGTEQEGRTVSRLKKTRNLGRMEEGIKSAKNKGFF